MFNIKKETTNSFKLFQLFIGITFLFLFTSASAQVLNSNPKSDTIKAKNISAPYHSPKKAALYSAVLPGTGQLYNKKYWKMPIVYAGFAGLAYSFQFNQSRYVKYRDALKNRLNGNPDNYIGIYDEGDLTSLYQYYHRYRDITVLGGLVLYVLNIVDAAVDAHLYTFNVSDDLSFNIHPTIINTYSKSNYTTGIGLSIHF